MERNAKNGMQLDNSGKVLLKVLVEHLPKVKPGVPQTYISYKRIHTILGLEQWGATYGESLKNQGLNSLANWTKETNKPGITGLIINQQTMMPGDGYFKLFNRPLDDFEWWGLEVKKTKEFDWSVYLLTDPVDEKNTNGDDWQEDELRASVVAYLEMLRYERAGEPFVKKQYYERLTGEFGRTAKSYEYRMQNISYVLALMGRDWLPGLKPAKNVGVKIATQIEKLIAEEEGRKVIPMVGFELAVRDEICKEELPKPVGNKKPSTTISTVTQYQRDATVKAWVLKQANGVCECCKKEAPFNGSDGLPYLEVHHVRTLADQGEDTVENAVAVCPNCHRELHYGEKAKELVKQLYRNIPCLNYE